MNINVCIDLFIALQQAGIKIVEDIPTCERLLRQTFASQKREMNLLIMALRERIPLQMILLMDIHADNAMLQNWARQLVKNHGITEDSSLWAVESWGVALGKTSYPLTFIDGIWNPAFIEKSIIRLGANTFLGYLYVIMDNLTVQNSQKQKSNVYISYNKRLNVFERAISLLKNWNSKQDPAYFLQFIHNNFKGQDLDEIGQAAKSLLEKRQLPYFSLKKSILAHRDNVSALAISNDGKRIFSASWDKRIKIWDYPGFNEMGSLIGHMDRITAIVIYKDDIACISGSADGIIIVWDLINKKSRQVISAHRAPIYKLEISSDGHWLISSAIDGEIQIWNFDKLERIYSIQSEAGENTSIAITSDNLAVMTIASKDLVKLWTIDNGRLKCAFYQTKQAVSLAIHPDGLHFYTANVDGSISLWNIASKIQLHSWQAHSAKIIELGIDPGGKVLGSLDIDGIFKAWDALNCEYIGKMATISPISTKLAVLNSSEWIFGNAGGGILYINLVY